MRAPPPSTGVTGPPRALERQPGTGAVLASGGDDGQIALWRPDSGRTGKRQKPTRHWQQEDAITALTWAAPNRLVSADRTGTVALHKV